MNKELENILNEEIRKTAEAEGMTFEEARDAIMKAVEESKNEPLTLEEMEMALEYAFGIWFTQREKVSPREKRMIYAMFIKTTLDLASMYAEEERKENEDQWDTFFPDYPSTEVH